MPTSATCRPPEPLPVFPGRARGRRAGAGFTLIEILLVLALLALLTGLVTPALLRTAQRIEFATQRDSALAEIDALGYRAYVQGKGIRLSGSPDPGAAAPLALPPGWALEVQGEAITWSPAGVCSGGRLALRDPGGEVHAVELKPPRCRVTREEDLG